MTNTHQTMIDESIDPGGLQNRRIGDEVRDSIFHDELMEDSQMIMEKTNSLKENRNIKSTEDMCVDKMDSERSGNSQVGDINSQQRFTKPTSYSDAFVNSDLKWEKCFQEWGLKELDIEMDGSNTYMTGVVDAVDGIQSISLDIETQKCIVQPWKRCLIGKVVGKTVGFKFISYKVSELWKPTYQVVNVEASFGPWMMVDKRNNKVRGGGVSMAAPKENNKRDVDKNVEPSGGPKKYYKW
ncbi:uncharacterized protein LOC113349619 isoform X2 [Papaver somniferum]|uniref:uncharacterized protein LOC113349619 isoform X2 n=1 Tax=Papaver somniferum TaxID=3469 RepID=UPI000E6FE416|nr:uncharacterized protein LOC113349619 isoform X2 [Papaver somniferum]